MPAVPTGLISEQLFRLKDMLLTTQAWQDWAGVDFADRVHYHANRIQIEGTNNFINTELTMPFAVLWFQAFVGQRHSPGCFVWSQRIMLLFQDFARTPENHDDSAIEYTNRLGPTIDEISGLVANHVRDSVHVDTIQMVGEALRVPPLDQNTGNDYWTSTWAFEVATP